MKKIRLFNLIEQSFLDLKRTNKKIWIIGVIITILSGGLISQGGLTSDLYSGYNQDYYSNEYLNEEEYEDLTDYSDEYDEDYYLDDIFDSMDFTTIIAIVVVSFIIIILVLIIISVLAYVVTYYLYHNVYKSIYDKNISRASLDKVVKVNLNIILKTIFAGIFFIIPGIIVALKYSPSNYVLSKYPELSSKEVLRKSKEISKGYKWKIFIFNLFIIIISSILGILISPSILMEGYIFLDIIYFVVTFMLTTFIIVYSSIFSINLFKLIDDLKNSLNSAQIS